MKRGHILNVHGELCCSYKIYTVSTKIYFYEQHAYHKGIQKQNKTKQIKKLINWPCEVAAYLCVELCEKLKVLLEVGGEDGLDDEEAEPFELGLVEVKQPVVSRVGEEEAPDRGSVVGLEDGPVVVEDSLETEEEVSEGGTEGRGRGTRQRQRGGTRGRTGRCRGQPGDRGRGE